MKNVKRTLLGKVFAFIVAISMLNFGTLSATSFAAEESENNDFVYTKIEATDQQYQDALKALNLTEEEARECNIYSLDSVNGVTVPNNGSFYYFDEFTFWDYNGGAYWTCQGNQLRWGVNWHATSESYEYYDLRLGLYLYRYPGGVTNEIDHIWLYCTNPNGDSYTSDWMSVVPQDYRFIYYSEYLTNPTKVPYVTLQMYVATRTV